MPAQGTPTPPLVGGNTAVDQILQGYVFQSGIHRPEHSNILSYKYPQYYVTALLDRLGASKGVAQDVYSWNILDKTREGGTVSSSTATGSATIDFTVTEFDFSSGKPGYLLVNDTIRLESGVVAKITASADNAGSQQVTAVKLDGTNWTAGDIADGDKFGHVFSAFPEGSSAPKGRLYLPTEEYNLLTTLRRTINITGSEFTNRTYIGDGSAWYFELENIEMKEFARDIELATLFGSLSDDGSTKVAKGIWDYVTGFGVTNGYSASSGVTEADIQAHIRDLMVEGGSDTITVLAGADFMQDFNVAMKDYHVNGAIDYGRFGDNMVGLDVQAYKFLGKTIYVKYYELFDDDAVVPAPAGALESGAGTANFSDTSLWLDMGTDSVGTPLIQRVHKELDGVSRKFIHAYEPGMVNPNGVGGQVASGDDAFKIYYLSEIGLEFRLPNRCGILRATSA